MIAFPDVTDGDALAVGAVVVVGGLAAPAAVHWGHGRPDRAALSAGGTVGATLATAALGLGIGSLLAGGSCDTIAGDAHRDDSCLPKLLLPFYGGILAGYVGWAVVDMVYFSSLETSRRVSLIPIATSTRAGLAVRGSL